MKKLVAVLIFVASVALAQGPPATPQWKRTGPNTIAPRRAGDSVAMVATLPTSGVTTVSATSLTLDATHNGHILKSTAGTDATYTLNTGIGLAGYSLLISQRGAGTVTVTAGAGVTIRQRQSYTKTAGQYAVASLVCDVDNDCILSGDLQ